MTMHTETHEAEERSWQTLAEQVRVFSEQMLKDETLPEHALPLVEGFLQLCVIALYIERPLSLPDWRTVLTEASQLTAIDIPEIPDSLMDLAVGLLKEAGPLGNMRESLLEKLKNNDNASRAYATLRA